MPYDTSDKEKNRLTKCCRISSNADGDKFVGIKADTDDVKIYFPLGYRFAKDDKSIRRDIRNLMAVLIKFGNRNEWLIGGETNLDFDVKFPMYAYMNVLEYYFSVGGYYTETEPIFRIAAKGKADWKKTVKNQKPLWQKIPGGGNAGQDIFSPVFSDFTVRAAVADANNLITRINRYCVKDALNKIGWLYGVNAPHEKIEPLNIKTARAALAKKLSAVFDDKKRRLFRSMDRILAVKDTFADRKNFQFGIEDFAPLWEKLIDIAFGEENKKQYFPHAEWRLNNGGNFEYAPLIPDTVMRIGNKFYILDAKYYRYGLTGNPNHLPGSADINKQITYGEYVEKNFSPGNDCLFNAFVMPYDKEENPFRFETVAGNIGEALGKWRTGEKNYERVQGIVLDVKYLMQKYADIKDEKTDGKSILAGAIEKVRE